jgi:DNA polymerase III subunit epsilon
MTRQIILDTETTGLYPSAGDRILEIGCVELVNRRLTGKHFHFYINPERDSHEEALKVHGITSEFLAEKPKFAEIASELVAYVQGAEVIIHNAPFDLGFLDAEFARLDLGSFKSHVHSVTDTLAMAKATYPGKRNSLDALCERLGVDNSGRDLHGALLDAQLLADVYINLTRGQDALLMDSHSAAGAPTQRGATGQSLDLRNFDLPLVLASATELAAHQEQLLQIDKASGGKTVWRKLGGEGANAAVA